MKHTVRKFIGAWQSDYEFKTFVSSFFSAIINFLYMIYNGYLGVCHSSIWNGSICVYYIMLAAIRAFVVSSRHLKPEDPGIRNLYIFTHILMLMMNAALIVPVIVMIRGERSYGFGLIPAISLAAYTFYKIIMVLINYRRSRKEDNLMVGELYTIRLIDTMVSILTLQNTLIILNEGKIAGSMKVLSIVSSICFLILISVITVLSFLKIRK